MGQWLASFLVHDVWMKPPERMKVNLINGCGCGFRRLGRQEKSCDGAKRVWPGASTIPLQLHHSQHSSTPKTPESCPLRGRSGCWRARSPECASRRPLPSQVVRATSRLVGAPDLRSSLLHRPPPMIRGSCRWFKKERKKPSNKWVQWAWNALWYSLNSQSLLPSEWRVKINGYQSSINLHVLKKQLKNHTVVFYIHGKWRTWSSSVFWLQHGLTSRMTIFQDRLTL